MLFRSLFNTSRHIWQTPVFAVFLLVFFSNSFTLSFAGGEVITATGEYVMGQGETVSIAKDRAVREAMSNAVEQVGLYLEGCTEVQQQRLTRDEVRAIAAGTVEIIDKSVNEQAYGVDNRIFSATITARVSIGSIESLQSKMWNIVLMKAYKELESDYARLRTEMEDLKKRRAAALTTDDIIALGTLINRNEQSFIALQYLDEGQRLVKKGCDAEAIITFGNAIEADSGNALAYYSRGMICAKKGQYDAALADFNQAIALNSQNADVYHERANVYYYKREYVQAISDYDRAIALNPQVAIAYLYKAICCEKVDKINEAIAAYHNYVAHMTYSDESVEYARQRIKALRK